LEKGCANEKAASSPIDNNSPRGYSTKIRGIGSNQLAGPPGGKVEQMSSRKYLDMPEPWVEISVTDEDWDAADPHLLTSMFSELVLIRSFEEYVLTLAGEGLVHGPAHSSIGQEGGAVG
jgi:hypothetical protein